MQTLATMPETPSTIEQVRAQLWNIVEDGLRQGLFEFAVTCDIVAGKERRLVIRAGKSHQYTIAEHELPTR